MIPKLGQYRKDGPRFPIKTGKNVMDLRDYLLNEKHKNHVTTDIGKLTPWRCALESFTDEINDCLLAFQNRPKSRGKPWGGEIAEHIILSPPENIDLSAEERDEMAKDAVNRLCPRSVAVYVWHVGADGRDHLHIIACNFTDHAMLRITDLREQNQSKGYLSILTHTCRAVVTAINKKRELAGKTRIPTLKEIRAAKRKAAGRDSLPEILFKALGPYDCLDRKSIQVLLEEKGWRVRPTNKNLSVTPPQKKKAYRWSWDVLLTQLGVLRDAWRQAALDMEQKRDQRHRDPGHSDRG